MKLAFIPAGEFQMGSPADEKVSQDDEHPQHRVKITRPFYLGIYEVTQGEWEKVMGSNPSLFNKTEVGKDTSRFPVDTVSWYDAIEYCNKLSQRENLSSYYRIADAERKDGRIIKASVSISGGNGYRLPSEAEWEYACRAGTTTPFHFGTTNNGQAANIDGNYPYGITTKGPYLQRTTAVGSYASNAFGLFDMHGNVWEWCFDGYDENAYQGRVLSISDPVITSVHDRRVLRGGSWVSFAWFSRSASRDWDYPDDRDDDDGFRVARTP